MNTFQIAGSALDGYKNEKLSDERINALVVQANTQIDEIAQNKELYDSFIQKVNAPQKIDNIILWVLFMSNEDIRDTYIETFDKEFRDDIPISDLADLLIYIVYLKKVKNEELAGFDYLDNYEDGDIEDVDQFALTNTFLYIQKTKEVQIDF
jgi:3-methyladenine DNA glycosylase AlkD